VRAAALGWARRFVRGRRLVCGARRLVRGAALGTDRVVAGLLPGLEERAWPGCGRAVAREASSVRQWQCYWRGDPLLGLVRINVPDFRFVPD
jgi:hypothetical protein